MEKYFDDSLKSEEAVEFENFLNSNKEYKIEFDEQKRIKEVLRKMKLKNPSSEIWDSYWERIYNRYERGLGWLAVFIGALLLIGYGSIEAVNHFFQDTLTPPVVKYGSAFLIFGIIVLMFSVIREKFFTSKHDKYKEIQR
jgi:hypothetical protein